MSDILARYKKVRNHTANLCSPLKTEDYVAQPVVDVSPPKWHLGHTTWFFELFCSSRTCRATVASTTTLALCSTVIMNR